MTLAKRWQAMQGPEPQSMLQLCDPLLISTARPHSAGELNHMLRGRFGSGQSRGRAVATRSATTSAHGRPRRIRAHLKVNYGAWGAPGASWTGTGSVPSPAGLCLNGNLPPSEGFLEVRQHSLWTTPHHEGRPRPGPQGAAHRSLEEKKTTRTPPGRSGATRGRARRRRRGRRAPWSRRWTP